MAKTKYLSTPYSYSKAVVAGDYVFIGLHRGGGESFEAQIKDTFENMIQTLNECNMNLSQLVKVNVWLKNINDLPEMEKIFWGYFEEGKFPARMTSTTGFIDDDCLLMIDAIAYTPTNCRH